MEARVRVVRGVLREDKFTAWVRGGWGTRVRVEAVFVVRSLCSPSPLPQHPPPPGGYRFMAQRVYRVSSLIADARAPQILTSVDHKGAVISLPESPLEGRVPHPETQLSGCPLVAPPRPLPSPFLPPPLLCFPPAVHLRPLCSATFSKHGQWVINSERAEKPTGLRGP